MKEDLQVGEDVIIINALHETYPQPEELNLVTNSFENTNMILGHDVFYAICLLEYFTVDKKCSAFAVSCP